MVMTQTKTSTGWAHEFLEMWALSNCLSSSGTLQASLQVAPELSLVKAIICIYFLQRNYGP